MKAMVKIVLLTALLSLGACDNSPIPGGYNYNEGMLPDTPENLSQFNSAYDDYNSTAPTLGFLIPFCFSTNRNSHGGEFDVIFQPMNVNFNKTTGILTVTNEYANWGIYEEEYQIISTGLNKIQTTGNELGPNLLPVYHLHEISFTLLYATDITGNAQINFISNSTDENFSAPREVQFLNSEWEDMYPTFNADGSRIYFCSDRSAEGFDIYYVEVDPERDLEDLLSDPSDYEVVRDLSLSGNSDDKCPFIFGNRMVFASNREGGFGGFDLYSSTHVNGKWSTPINLGPQINSAQDEYRPILLDEGVSQTHAMMVFSSNRPGGLGGFDLYFVGIEME
ncbi:MAG: hypothetical protein R6U66_14350 [Bacteroidales bacterium]